MPSLLPHNSTALEQAVESTISRPLPNLINTLWNPDTCPVEFLDYLAWGLAVNAWNGAWSEAQKRLTIKNALFVHQHKGTVSAVRAALANIGASSVFSEWFTTNQAPYTFDVMVWANANLHPNQSSVLNTSLYNDIKNALDTSKPARAHYSFKVGAQFNQALAITSTQSSAQSSRALAIPAQPTLFSLAKITAASTHKIAQVARAGMQATHSILAQRTVRMGVSTSSTQILRLTMETA